jgi:hypothetical protein
MVVLIVLLEQSVALAVVVLQRLDIHLVVMAQLIKDTQAVRELY